MQSKPKYIVWQQDITPWKPSSAIHWCKEMIHSIQSLPYISTNFFSDKGVQETQPCVYWHNTTRVKGTGKNKFLEFSSSSSSYLRSEPRKELSRTIVPSWYIMTHLVLWVGRYEVFQEGKSALKQPQGALGPFFLAYIQKPKTNAEKKVDTSHSIKKRWAGSTL